MVGKTGQAQPQSTLVSMTVADVQRQNREAAQKRKTMAIRIAGSFAIGLHVIGLIVGTIYFVRKTVLDINDDKVESVVLTESKPQPKRRTPPRTSRKPTPPKFSKVQAPKGQSVTTSAKIPMGNARFTLPASNVSTRPVIAPSTAGIGRNLFRGSRQASIVTTMPKFEVPKFENTTLVSIIGFSGLWTSLNLERKFICSCLLLIHKPQKNQSYNKENH